mgnify:CR=1 FL=1
MAYVLQHTRLGFCWLDLVALVILLVVVGVYIHQHRKLKKLEKQLDEKLTAIYAEKAVEPETV